MKKRLCKIIVFAIMTALVSFSVFYSVQAKDIVISGEYRESADEGVDYIREPVSTVDAMPAIESALGSYRLGDVKTLADDGHIGIPVYLSVYYKSSEAVNGGAGGTPIVLYVVNTSTVRVGTRSDSDIIYSMLDRGYAVVIADYKYNEKAVSPALDWSAQSVRAMLTRGEFFEGLNKFPSGTTYYETFIVPAGHDVSLNHVYWEFDKHGADGTFENIVDVWNTDFRKEKGETVIKWTDESGNRKAVQNAFDGSLPIWCNADGTSNTNGNYIRIKYTKAEKITDCVKKDGTPIDLSLYMHIIYPTNPKNAVPVMALNSSSENLAKGADTLDRPQAAGFAFNGYASVMFDFGYTPMARDDHYGYLKCPITGDALSYAVHFYSDKLIGTAAMRYIRYLALSDSRFHFDTCAIGVYGNSKGGWMTYLGEENPEMLVAERIFSGHHGETRYENNKTADEGVIDGGEAQPWLAYNGKVIDSGADFVYASCGGLEENMTAGHAPTYVSCNIDDPSYYTSSNAFVNMCRIYDIPCLWFEIDKGHTLASGKDISYNVDTYSALFDFANFYLKKEPVKLLYTDLQNGEDNVSLARDFFFMFSGGVSREQIEKLTPISSSGDLAEGEWTSSYGGTHWTFSPKLLKSNELYTVSLPKSFYGTNKVRIEQPQGFYFLTEYATTTEDQFITTSSGTYAWFEVTESDEYVLRAYVKNNASNRLQLYALSNFDSKNPDNSTLGELIEERIVYKSGNVEFNITDYCKSLPLGTRAAFLIKESKSANKIQGMNINFDGGNYGGVQIAGNILHKGGIAPDGSTALEISEMQTNTQYASLDAFYNNITTIAAKHGPIRAGTNGKLTASDVGRKFRISFRVYDTYSRTMQVYIKSPTSETDGISDYHWSVKNFYTEENKWVDVELEYVIYEPALYPDKEFGVPSMIIKASAIGNVYSPFYIDSLKAVEIIDSVDIESASIESFDKLKNPADVPTSESLSQSALGVISEKAHPYILYESSEIAELREKIKNGYSAKAFKYVEKTAKNYMKASISVYYNSDSDKSTPVIGRLLQSYVAYLNTYSILTGDEQYARKAVELVIRAAEQGNTDIYYGINDGLCVSDFGYAYAIAYDWLYSYLNDYQKVLLKNEMEEIGAWIYYYSLNPSGTEVWGDESPENLIQRKAWNWNAVTHGALGMISVSLAKDTAHSDWLTRSIERMKGYYSYSIDAQGCAFEGVHYIGYALNTLSVLDDLICNMTGVELLDYYPHVYKLTDWSMRMTAPYGNEQVGLGQGSKLDNYAALLYLITKGHQRIELWGWERTYDLQDGGNFTGDYAGNGFNAPNVIFFEDQTLEPIAPADTIPLITDYERGLVIARDGWDDNDSLMTFFSGWGWKGTWNHPDNNTFTFFANGESFIIDLGANYKTSKDHNVVIVDETGFYYDAPYMIAGELLANKNLSNGALYVMGENSDSYRDTVLTESTRQLVYMGGGTPYVIAFDHALGSNVTHKYTTSFYTYFESEITVISNSSAKIVGGNTGAVAYAYVYSPESATLSVSKTDKTNALVTENNAIVHNQITLYITANPDGSAPNVNFSLNSSGNITVVIEYYVGEELHKDAYTFSNSTEPVSLSSSATPEETVYGTIPAEYANKTDYPFAVFRSDKTFVGAYSDWAIDAKASALHSSKETSSVVLLRRDYTYTGGQYNNLSQTKEGIVIDLGGFTFTSTNRSLFAAQKKNNYNTGITVKNGSINIGAAALIRLNSGASSGGVAYEGKNGFDFTFENIEIILSSGAAAESVVCYNVFSDSAPNMFCNITFNNCKFDLSRASKALNLFDMSDAHAKVCAKINGGEIIASSYQLDLASDTVGNDSSSLTFGKYENAYTSISLPVGSTTKLGSVNGGNLTFVKKSENDIFITYVLTESAILPFTPKMSIMLENELVVNVYVPSENVVQFTACGNVYNSKNTFGGKKTTLDDGKDYYLVSIPLGSSEAAQEITLIISPSISAYNKDISFTLSITEYAQKILADASATDVEQQLVRNVLLYIRESYEYFGTYHNTDTEIARATALINSIIGENYKSRLSLSTESVDDASSVKSVTLNLDARPTVRFFVTNTDIELYSNGKLLTTSKGTDAVYGDYVELDVDAYELCNVIAYGNGGSYHISSFVTGSAGTDYEALVKAFVKYIESAAAYRAEILSKDK